MIKKLLFALIASFFLPALFSAAQNPDRERFRRDRPEGAANRSSPGGLLNILDRNGDGQLQQMEIDMAVVALRRLDTDRDGVVSSAELALARSAQGNSATAPSRPDRPDTPPGVRPGGRFPGFAALDRDGDGNISKEEAPERMRERWDMIDSNRDGKLDKAEQEALQRRMRERMQQAGNRRPERPGLDDAVGGERPKRPPLKKENPEP